MRHYGTKIQPNITTHTFRKTSILSDTEFAFELSNHNYFCQNNVDELTISVTKLIQESQ